MRTVPLVLGIVLLAVGWATGRGAAQILFTLFGEVVFNAGAAGIGLIWGCAGVGLLIGGVLGNWFGKRLAFERYKRVVFIDYIVSCTPDVLFSRMQLPDLPPVFLSSFPCNIPLNSVS